MKRKRTVPSGKQKAKKKKINNCFHFSFMGRRSKGEVLRPDASTCSILDGGDGLSPWTATHTNTCRRTPQSNVRTTSESFLATGHHYHRLGCNKNQSNNTLPRSVNPCDYSTFGHLTFRNIRWEVFESVITAHRSSLPPRKSNKVSESFSINYFLLDFPVVWVVFCRFFVRLAIDSTDVDCCLSKAKWPIIPTNRKILHFWW